MHTFAALPQPPADHWSVAFARGMSLIHVAAGGQVLRILTDGLLRTGDGAKRPSTAASDDDLGARHAYFFAGRSYPAPLGSAAFRFPPDAAVSSEGHGSPFDTGGVLRGRSKLPSGTASNSEPRGYVAEHSAAWNVWRDYLARHAAAHFAAPHAYWGSGPNRAIDGVTLGRDDWRDWAFETRSRADVPLEGADVFATKSLHDQVTDSVLRGEFDPARHPLVERIVPTDDPPGHAEQMSALRCGA